ncbi:molybdopterin-guanine dinucleotide biosynthesis protein B [Novimethylophilus kurashikiensis]|nr:molybdopterin-guanine dinucleotide biosynthesis protein B [Novimethylophilus kurashikiensis]
MLHIPRPNYLKYSPPILGICAAASGMGKTTLMEKILPILKSHGLRIGVIKQARADFDTDHPGKDSHRLRLAGADSVMVGSSKRWALMTELPQEYPDNDDSRLKELIPHMNTTDSDLILVEGFREASIPKIEVYRACLGYPLRALKDKQILAVASDTGCSSPKPILNINSAEEVVSFILEWHFAAKKSYKHKLVAEYI